MMNIGVGLWEGNRGPGWGNGILGGSSRSLVEHPGRVWGAWVLGETRGPRWSTRVLGGLQGSWVGYRGLERGTGVLSGGGQQDMR